MADMARNINGGEHVRGFTRISGVKREFSHADMIAVGTNKLIDHSECAHAVDFQTSVEQR
jgi:hypothetical protein